MGKYQVIVKKLERFIRKYYTNELLKGVILFFAIGLLYFLLTVGLEWIFWLGKTGRLILFWLFVAVEVSLFARFIIYPILKLFKISKGISYEEAARIIGKHFHEVNDKLLNILQLKATSGGNDNELLLAGIDQKADELQPIPFQTAINFKGSLKYLKFAIIPILLFLGIWISGKANLFSDSYNRVVNYQEAYEPPAPFSFHILNEDLNMKENERFTLKVHTMGNLVPDRVNIYFDGETYLMKNDGQGAFSYTFEGLDKNTSFHLFANEVKSKDYDLNVVNIPKILDFDMELVYPAYLGKTDKKIKGTGNLTLPEGTKVTWQLNTQSTDQVELILPDTLLTFDADKKLFKKSHAFYRNMPYKIATSNEWIDRFEELTYQVKVIRDQYPEIKVDMKRDSLRGEQMYFKGQVSDDYGLTGLQMVYYPVNNPKDVKWAQIPIGRGNYDEFISVFPDTLSLVAGVPYEVYFQVFDNDGVNGRKIAKTETFGFRKLTDDEREAELLNSQKESIEGMKQTLEKMQETEKDRNELEQLQKEKDAFNYNDRKKVEDYLKRVQQENEMMKHYTEKMKKDLEDFQNSEQDFEKDNLLQRMEENEKKLEGNEDLMEELKKYQEKLSKEDMAKKLEEMAKEGKKQNRSLEELLELTKRYYVQKKQERLADDLIKLGEEQEKLSEKGEENNSEAQEDINRKFDRIKEELDDLQKENNNLRKPKELGRDEAKERETSKDLEDAKENLEEAEADSNDESDADGGQDTDNEDDKTDKPKQKAQKSQKSAAEKMKQMGAGMQMDMMTGDMEQLGEDIASLRQILDNLIIFSFEQEDLLMDFEKMERNSSSFGNRLQHQQHLKENFKHIDDSLYALALRNPMIGDFITENLVEVEYNINKSMEHLAKFDLNNGTKHQQFTLTKANDLANMLDDALMSMEMMMDMMGTGQGSGNPQPSSGGEGKFQLEDIIQGQEDLNEGMEEGMQDGDGEQEGGQEDGEEGEGEEGGEQDGPGGDEGREQGGGNFGNEENSARLFEIYKQQEKLRMELEDLIRREGLGIEAKKLAEDMERVEQELLRNGFSRKNLEIMKQMKERMIKMHEASYLQEEEDKREATTNKETFSNTSKENFDKAKDYFQSLEILNRQSLPLQPEFKKMVQDYFKNHD